MHSSDTEDLPKDHQKPQENEELLSEGTFRSSSRWTHSIFLYFNTNFWGKFVLITLNEIRKNKAKFLVGFFSCALIVFVLSLLVTVIRNSPVVFLKLAEIETGEIDFQVRGRESLLNYTLIERLIVNNEEKVEEYDLTLNAPRYQGDVIVYLASDCPEGLDPFDPSWKYTDTNATLQAANNTMNESCTYNSENCFPFVCSDAKAYKAELILADSKREERMELGREWIQNDFGAPSEGNVYMRDSFAGALGISEGQLIYVHIDAQAFFTTLWNTTVVDNIVSAQWTKDQPTIHLENIYVPFNVSRIFVGSQGKFSDYSEEVIIAEYKAVISYISKHINTNMPDQARAAFSSADLYQYAQFVMWNMPDRLSAYLEPNFDDIQATLIDFTNYVLYIISFGVVNPSLPVLESLQQTTTPSVFLGMILQIVIVVLLILSVLLIYSLLTITVESKMFDMGVLRYLGITQGKLLYIVVLQSLSFTIPALVVGLVMAQVLSVVILGVLGSVTHVYLSPILSPEPVLLSCVTVFVVPFVSSVLPMRGILGRTIQSALDKSHSKTVAVEIQVERSEESYNKVYWNVVFLGCCLAIFGFVIYYIFPYSLLMQRYDLLSYILVSMLLGMLLGAVLLTMNILHLLENLFLYIFCFWEKRNIRELLKKNLIAHKKRNQSTSVMYALSLGFIIFLGVNLTIQSDTFFYQQKQSAGVYFDIYASGVSKTTQRRRYIPQEAIEQIELVASSNKYIAGHALVSTSLTECLGSFDSKDTLQDQGLGEGTEIEVQNIGHLFNSYVNIYAASPNFYDIVFEEFVIMASKTAKEFDTASDMMNRLYSIVGSTSIIMGTADADKLNLFVANSHVLLNMPSSDSSLTVSNVKASSNYTLPQLPPATLKRRMKPLGFLDSSSSFYFSKYPQQYLNQDAVVSFTTFLRLTNGNLKSVEDIPVKSILIKLAEDITNDQMDEVKQELERAISIGSLLTSLPSDDYQLRFWDYRQVVVRAQLSRLMLAFFLNFTIAIAMLICFFSLMSSMYSNIMDQSKEIGILRVLGLTKLDLIRLYIYEAFLVVFSSSLLGISLGTFIGWTMSIQSALMNQLPLTFKFPFSVVIIVFVLSALFGFLSSWFPLRRLLGLSIVSLLRN